MDDQKEKELDALIRSIQPTPLKVDLYDQIMAQVSLQEVPKTPSPLIGKKGWYIIMIGLIAMVVGLFSTTPLAIPIDVEVPLNFQLPAWNLKIPTWQLNVPFKGTETLIYGVVFLGLFFFIQVKMMSKYFLKSSDSNALG